MTLASAFAIVAAVPAAAGLAPYLKLTGTGADDTKAEAGRFEAKPGVPYVFSCEMRHPAGEDTGVAVMTPAGVSMYTSPRGHGWNGFTNAFVSLSGTPSAACELRQWHIPGVTEFRNVRVAEAVARYRRVGGAELGFGESIDGSTYRYSTLFSHATHNHSRPTAAKQCKKGETHFVHEIGGRTILSARVGIAVDGGADAVAVAVSCDGGEWVDVLSASSTGVFHVDVPAGFLPAKRLFARVRNGTDGKAAKFRQYMFDAEVDGPAAFGFGATDYLDAGTGEVLLSAKPMDYLDDTTSGFALGGAPEGVACWAQSSGRKVLRGRPAPTAAGGALKIAAARNEAESAQLVLRPDRPLEGVRVTADVPEGIDVEIRRVGYVLVDLPMDSMGARGMWPDPIFDQDARGCDIPPGANQPFWVTAKPRRGMKAGTYRGEIKVAAARGMAGFSVPIEVRVFDFDFPDRVTCRTAFGLSFGTVFEYHHAKNRADMAAIAEKYLEMFSRHHVSPYSPYAGVTVGTYTDRWTRTPDPADSEPVFSWDAWDEAVSNALCRYNFNTFKVQLKGLGSKDPLSRMPRKPRVINGVSETNRLYEVYMARYLKAIESHLRERGWLDKAYVYAFDEPEKADYEYMRESLQMLKRHAPSLQRMVTMEPRGELEGDVGIWCPITEKYDGERARARQKAGDDVWWYITFSSKPPKANEHIEHPGVDMRVWLWQTWLEKVQGVLMWETACWNRKTVYADPERPQNPYEDSTVWSKARPWNSGEGKYVYPPEECFRTKDPVVAGPVDSIRFEMLREGLEDYEYFAMLQKADPGNPLLSVPSEVASSLDDYSADPSGMEAHRVRLAEAIERASSVTLAPGATEVLVAPNAPKARSVAWFAAQELTNFLSRAFGRPVPIVTSPTPGKTAVVVGTNAWSEAAGVDVGKLPRDGFVVCAVPGRVFVAGRDMAGPFNPAKDFKGGEKATLFGVYDFLERYVGCRFYFPGEIGEVVPRVASVSVPTGERAEAPEFIERKVRYQLGEWFEPVSKAQCEMNEALCHYRWRLQTRAIPCCHGLQYGHYLARFGKTHPEYFCQRKDGTRMNDEEGSFPSPSTYRGQYCHTSAIWDEIYKDARSYFLGEGPEVRGMMAERNQRVVPGHEWRWQAAYGMYYDVMPQDNFQRCWCEKCTEAFAKAKDPAQYATELVWGRVAECARRLIGEGVPGCLTMMSYNPYKNVPDFDIPTNVLVMVCSNGAWAKEKFQEADLRRLKAWNEKCGRKLHIWNNSGKHVCFNLNYVDMPGVTPRAYGKYYRRLAPYIFGAYCDNQSEKFVYSALNYYVFSRLAWNSAVDADALLGEYYRLMFGNGAEAMRRFDEELEDIWMNEIISTQVETALGPMNAGISTFELWSRVVDMKRIRRFDGLFREAMQAVEPGSMEARRIEFFRRQMLEPMAEHAREFDFEAGVAAELAARKARGAVSVLKGFAPVEFDVTTTNKDVHAKSFKFKAKCGRGYRVSYVIGGENLAQYGDTPEKLRIARMWGGALGSVRAGGKTLGTVGRGVRGTFRPVVQAFEFVVPGECGREVEAELRLMTFLTTGHVRFDSLMVEEKEAGR